MFGPLTRVGPLSSVVTDVKSPSGVYPSLSFSSKLVVPSSIRTYPREWRRIPPRRSCPGGNQSFVKNGKSVQEPFLFMKIKPSYNSTIIIVVLTMINIRKVNKFRVQRNSCLSRSTTRFKWRERYGIFDRFETDCHLLVFKTIYVPNFFLNVSRSFEGRIGQSFLQVKMNFVV